jgi:hypothetical protein
MKTIDMPDNMKVIEMDTSEWEDQFKPITNHLDSNASWQNEEGDGIMFETYGEELEYVKKKHKENPNCIWTLMDSDDGEDTIVVEGYHFVNRIGYFITENPYQERVNYIIK